MTLTQTATIARRSILGFIIFSILGITSFIGYKIWYAQHLSIPKEEIPDSKFGILPQPDLPPSLTPSSNFSYSLDTTTGGLPQFGKTIKVYFLPKSSATFLAAEKGQSLAAKFKISAPPQSLSETKQKFQQENRSLTVELDTGNFQYTSDATPSGAPLDDDNKLKEDFKNFLSNLGVLKEDLSGQIKINSLKYDNGEFTPAVNRTEASAAQIYVWPADLDKLPIVTPEFNKSLVGGQFIGSAKALENLRSLNFTFWPVDNQTSAVYPLKPPQTAFDELKSGKGTVIVVPSGNQASPASGPAAAGGQVSITSVYLAYFESGNYTPYLQPVFVFEGPQFVSYVPAIPPQFLSQ